MGLAYESMEVIKAMAETGNPNSVSDAGVGALCARAAVRGAFLNVRINASSYGDKEFVKDMIAKGEMIDLQAKLKEDEIMTVVNGKIG